MTHIEKTFGPSRYYALEEKVGQTWVPAPAPIAKRFTQREHAERYIVDTVVPAWPERKFRIVVIWP